MIREIGLVVAAYLLGSIPTGLLLARLKGTDIRAVGSGNIGATNVTRNLGKALGAITLIGDVFKGLLPVLLAKRLEFSNAWLAGVAFAAFSGHIFPLYLKFRGGKGVATAFGVMIGVAPLVALIGAGVWLVGFAITRHASVGSLAAGAAFPVAMGFLRPDRFLISFAALVGFLIYVRHRENIRKLLEGTEGQYTQSPSTPANGSKSKGTSP